jgi:acetyl-CoA carboxylase carboxyl transferase subunit alpha
MSDLLDNYTLEFEKPIKDLETQIEELKQVSNTNKSVDINYEIKTLQLKVNSLLDEIFENLKPWERVQLSRHPKRPHTVDYIESIIDDFHEVRGDRHFADDAAIITGFGKIDGQRVCVIGIEKGRKTKEKVNRNFGMPRPEGYRKALRVMKMAGRFNIPIVTLVDTPGAYPGIGAEERGQACAIAENLAELFDVRAPIVACIIGEGGSGGALGIAIADKVFMMEYSIYSVISPESCASILWADPKMAETAANSLQLSPEKALELNVIDGIIKEPHGGAQKDPVAAMKAVKKRLLEEIKKLSKLDKENLLEKRFTKFRNMGNETMTFQ